MSDFLRYAVYYLPDDRALAAFGAAWLGWDVENGETVAQPRVSDIQSLTSTPRRYGFHATLKPPFRLDPGATDADLAQAVGDLARSLSPVRLDGLRLAAIGRFLALVPVGDTTTLNALAFECVAQLDRYRHPPEEAELKRRRESTLTARQDDLLVKWGYPYVAEEFRFHMTLTGKLDPEQLSGAREEVGKRLPRVPSPFEVASISLVGEDREGMFHLLHRYTLTG